MSIFHSVSFIYEGESFLSETDIPSISQLEKRNDVILDRGEIVYGSSYLLRNVGLASNIELWPFYTK